MTECATAEFVRDRGREAMHRLIRGERFQSHRILREISALRIPFASLEAAADGMAAHAPIAIDAVSAAFRQIVHAARTDVGMVVITTAFYGRTAVRNPRLAVAEIEFLVTSGERWWVSEAAARRAMVPLLEHHRTFAWRVLDAWVRRDCPWLRRCVAGTVRHAFLRGLVARRPEVVPILTGALDALADEAHPTVRAAAIDALRAVCDFDPVLGSETILRWLDRGCRWLGADAWSSLDDDRRAVVEHRVRADRDA